MTADHLKTTSGIDRLDDLLDGLYIGDNVVWYDTAGSLAYAFCLNFMRASLVQKKPLIYVSFDRSPRNLLDKLGNIYENSALTILDCFTYGKGAGADVFLDFYREKGDRISSRITCVREPRKMEKVMDAFYGIHNTLEGDVRFVFESLTGMQELWEGEEHLLGFYSHSCPRLYELNTIAYWIIEKEAHSPRLKARINQIAQVAIDLSVKRGKTALTILKAEKRESENLNRPFLYWGKNLDITFESKARIKGAIDLGTRIKALRSKQGLSQTDLAKRVGVTPSTISQVESNLIYPSLPALFKMAEILSVDAGSFFQDSAGSFNKVIFPGTDAKEVKLAGQPKGSLSARLLTPVDFDSKAEIYLIEISPGKSLSAHFLAHKGEEMGYLLSGRLQAKIENAWYTVKRGDVVHLKTEIPSQWKNPAKNPARLLWIKIG